jgi:hypothetical protein
MPPSAPDPLSRIRYAVYGLLIVTCLGTVLGHLAAIRSPRGGTAMLSANDRSRWATIRSLVDHGTYALDDVVFRDARQQKRDNEWYSIDMVRHRGGDGREHFYSSKPPLLATLLAGEYWLIQRTTGATLAEQPFYVMRVMLVLNNVLPLALYFVLLAGLVERCGQTDWGRLFVMAAAVFGTFLTTFAVTLNNHLPAAISVAVAVFAAWPIWYGERPRWPSFALSGFFAAFATANELPALSFAVFLFAALCWKAPRPTLLIFVPAALVVVLASCLTNYIAHDSWRPPYAHRRNGEVLASVPGDWGPDLNRGQIPGPLRAKLSEVHVELSPQTEIRPRAAAAGWVLWDPDRDLRLALVADTQAVHIHAWDNWYEYERSYWTSGEKSRIDQGEPSRAAYTFHVLLGHHGILSLTPIWVLSVVGLGLWSTRAQVRMRGPAVLTAGLTVVCLGFYLARPLVDRNYGGVTCGFRWVFWLIPLWLLALVPAADALAQRPLWRWIALALLLMSVFSATYPALNPWSHPWIYQYWDSLGWLP